MKTDDEYQGTLRSNAIQEAVLAAESAIASSGGVLICGEPSTGRELFARAIHDGSHSNQEDSVERLLLAALKPSSNGHPFIVIDCRKATELEERLFGRLSSAAEHHESQLDFITPDSALCQALGGTLLIRQMPEMPRPLQARLARVLHDGEAWLDLPEGPVSVRGIRIRLMATLDATSDHDGETRIDPDLLNRLSSTAIYLPPLRERREDIPAMIRHLLPEICAGLSLPPKTISNQAVALLAALPWRGNIRELRGLLRTVVMEASQRVVRVTDVLAHVRLDGRPAAQTYRGTLKEARARFERDYVAAVLEQHHGRMAEAARALGLQRTNLYRKVRQLSVDRRSRRGV